MLVCFTASCLLLVVAAAGFVAPENTLTRFVTPEPAQDATKLRRAQRALQKISLHLRLLCPNGESGVFGCAVVHAVHLACHVIGMQLTASVGGAGSLGQEGHNNASFDIYSCI